MKKFRVALVEAMSQWTHVYSKTSLPRVGLATLGAILKQKGYSCDVWIKPITDTERQKLKTYDLVGIGSLSSTIGEAYALADELKKHGVKVVMGGPHVSFLTEEALNHCDYVIKGEGDISFPTLVDALNDQTPVDSIEGLSFIKPDGSFHNGGFSPHIDLSDCPSPDFLLSPQIKPNTVPPIVITSRGCPHNCSFCSVTPIFGRKYRFKSHEQVISEIRPVQHRSICFGDDNFCANPVRTKSLLREMIAQDAVPLRWSGQMCVDAAADKELLSLMKETRCRIVYVGIESVDPDTLKKYGKIHHLDAIKRCVDNLHDHGIGIHGMFVVDTHDNVDAAEKIVDAAIDLDIDTIQLFSITPFPGTRAYDENQDRILHQDWSKYDGMHVVTRPEHGTPHDLQASIIKQMKRFYSLKRVMGSYKKNRGWRIKYRLGGNVLLKRWISENNGYMKWLKDSSLSN